MRPAQGSRASRVGGCQHLLGGEGEWDSPQLVTGGQSSIQSIMSTTPNLLGSSVDFVSGP